MFYFSKPPFISSLRPGSAASSSISQTDSIPCPCSLSIRLFDVPSTRSSVGNHDSVGCVTLRIPDLMLADRRAGILIGEIISLWLCVGGGRGYFGPANMWMLRWWACVFSLKIRGTRKEEFSQHNRVVSLV